jgi:MFS family permease
MPAWASSRPGRRRRLQPAALATQRLRLVCLAYSLGGFRATRTLFTALIRPLVHESQMGLAYGLSETVLGLTGILAPIIAGFLYQRDKSLIYPIALVCILAVIILSLFLAPRQPKTPAAPVIDLQE